MGSEEERGLNCFKKYVTVVKNIPSIWLEGTGDEGK